MIGRLRGVLAEKHPPYLLLDVQGVGYEVQAPMTTFYPLAEVGSEVTLLTHLAISETAQQLYGFYTSEERTLFRLLIKVSGVGPKMALGILSGMDADEFVRCVMDGNVPALVKVPGVGKKTAERLVVEMRDRLKDWHGENKSERSSAESSSQPAHAINRVLADAESALVSLGYKPVEASKAVAAVLDESKTQRSEELIRLALRNMLPKS